MVLSQEQLRRAFCDGAGKFIFAQLPLIWPEYPSCLPAPEPQQSITKTEAARMLLSA
jgi:hypothetical protein